MFKIIIEKIETTEYPETDYKYLDEKDEDGYKKKEYFKTGKTLLRTDTTEIYSQLTDEEIDVKRVIDAFNQ